MSNDNEVPLDVVADVISSDITEVTEFETEEDFFRHIERLETEELDEIEKDMEVKRTQFRDEGEVFLEEFEQLIEAAEDLRKRAEQKHDMSSCCLKAIMVIVEERNRREDYESNADTGTTQ